MTAKTYSCPMKMPWSVKLSCWWFIALTVVFGGWLLLMTIPADDQVLGFWAYQAFLGVLADVGVIALCIGFVLALAKGRRAWVEVPYAVIGGLAFLLLPLTVYLTEVDRDWSVPEMMIYLMFAACAVILPLVLLSLPSSSRWMAYARARRRPGIGCSLLAMLAFFGMFSAALVVPAHLGRLPALTSALASRGHEIYLNLPRADLSNCTNSIEYVERLAMVLGKDADLYFERAGKEWSFAVNVPTSAPDSFPVMITANVNPEIVPRSWDGKTGMDDVLDLVPLMSENPLPNIGYDAIVVMRKCGAAQVLKKRYITRRNLLPTEPYELGKDTYYLTPTGKVYPK